MPCVAVSRPVSARVRRARRLACAAAVAVAAASMGPAVAGDLAQQARLFLDAQLLQLNGDVEVTMGEPDGRAVLAECARAEPFIPPNARLWGRGHVGVRCVEGATWTTYVPIHVRIYAPAPVAARPIARGEPIGPADYRLERVEITQWPPGEIPTGDQIAGRVATRAIAGAETIRRGHLRLLPLIAPGEAVQVTLKTASFAISTEGRALTSAALGEGVQVTLASGKTLWGTAGAGKVVTVK